MNTKEYLDKVAYVKEYTLPMDDDEGYVSNAYFSKYDGSYITQVGMEDRIKFLAEREITEELTHGVGFSPKDGKWYGWSHRAIYGFEIGSTCKKGDCHYKGSDELEQRSAAIGFWDETDHLATWVEQNTMPLEDGSQGLLVQWIYNDTVYNESLHGKVGGATWRMDLGRGEWTAKTMGDAKQMAIDFNNGVS